MLIGLVVTLSIGDCHVCNLCRKKSCCIYAGSASGPTGQVLLVLLQPLADGVKLFFKEEIIPTASSKFLIYPGTMPGNAHCNDDQCCYSLGHISYIYLAEILPLQIADINIGILYIFGVVSMGVYGIMIGGWASNNKFSLLAAIRGASQMISYELAMGLSLIALLMLTGSLRMSVIVKQPDDSMAGILFISHLGF